MSDSDFCLQEVRDGRLGSFFELSLDPLCGSIEILALDIQFDKLGNSQNVVWRQIERLLESSARLVNFVHFSQDQSKAEIRFRVFGIRFNLSAEERYRVLRSPVQHIGL